MTLRTQGKSELRQNKTPVSSESSQITDAMYHVHRDNVKDKACKRQSTGVEGQSMAIKANKPPYYHMTRQERETERQRQRDRDRTTAGQVSGCNLEQVQIIKTEEFSVRVK